MLLIFAVVIVIEAVQRFYNPVTIIYKEAILVAIIGLVVNIASAFFLHHDHEHTDRLGIFTLLQMHLQVYLLY